VNTQTRKLSHLTGWDKNPRAINKKDYERLKKQIKNLGIYKPLLINQDNVVLGGNMRLKAYQELGIDEVPVSVVDAQTEARMVEFALSDNDRAGYYLDQQLAELVQGIDIDLGDYMVDLGKQISIEELLGKFGPEPEEDEFDATPPDEPVSELGEVYQLGRHRLMCGDSTKIEDVERLMDGQKADMVFTDPPYGMKKENEGVLNDNLNYDDLLEFNKQWIPLTFTHLKDNGSWYCWGTDEPLMDIYVFILKPYIKENKITFRNLITWDKGGGQGQNSEEFRMYAIADEKLLFVMTGVQGFNTNQDNYYEAWEPVRLYLEGEKKKLGWTDKWIAEQLNIDPRLHWFSKSQWEIPTEEKYKMLQDLAKNEAFKKDYEEIKKDYYATRAYFNNTHDNMNNVWRFNRDVQNTDHATPKPIELCARAIKTSSREDELCLDLFGGSGSTLVACEQTNRTCFMMELDPKYCDVIRKRYAKLIGQEEAWQEITPIIGK
jgi:DNA modification methylase